EFHFLDEDYNKLYSSEVRLGIVMNLFACIAIVLACLGLFGLSAYTAQQRFKEIGVRKVLGASVSSLVLLLSKDFIKLVVIAFILASPVSWYAMNNWLNDCAYRIKISTWIFITTGLLAVIIALATI